jgi:hypothetical protein
MAGKKKTFIPRKYHDFDMYVFRVGELISANKIIWGTPMKVGNSRMIFIRKTDVEKTFRKNGGVK